MRTIAIINQKGGCGKTTSAINLSAVLAEKGHRTLLVDMDPQAHCALGLAVPEAQVGRSIADMLRRGLDGSLGFEDVVWQVARKFDLAPSTMALAGIEAELANSPDRDRRLMQILSTVRDKYDFCIIDCPPSIGLLTFNALRAADEVIVPVETGYFALQGSVKQAATIEMLARRAAHHVRFKVMATMYDVRTKLAREILSELKRQFGEKLLPVVVNFNSKLKEAASFGQAITEYDPASRGYQDFEKLVAWLMANPPAAVPEMIYGDEENAQGIGQADGEAGLTAGDTANPRTNRAAELVERARELSARTAALAERLSTGGSNLPDPSMPATELPATALPATALTGMGMPGPGNDRLAAVTASLGKAPIDSQQPDTGQRSQTDAAEPSITMTADMLPTSPPTNSPQMSQAIASSTALRGAPATSVNNEIATRSAAEMLGQSPSKRTPNLQQKLAKIYGVKKTAQGILFVQPSSGGNRMYIAGDFNGWSDTATPLRLDETLNVWQACVNVPPGRYRYRLVVDGEWIQDPYNSYVESNPFGELNNVIELGVESAVKV